MSTSMGGSTGFKSSMGAGQTGNVIPKGYKAGQLQNFSPEQMDLFQRLFGQVGPNSNLSRLAGGDQSQFEQLEAPALKQFNELQGNVASRFSGMGSGARKSSGFQNSLTGATSDFAQQLQSQRMQIQRQALSDLMGMSESLLNQRPQENFLIQKQQKLSFSSQLFGAGLPIAGAAIGGAFGGPVGAQIGGSVGSAAAKGFS